MQPQPESRFAEKLGSARLRSAVGGGIRVGVIGLGYWGPNLVRVFDEHQGATVAGVVDAVGSRATAIAARYPRARVFETAEELIATDIDAIIVATPLQSHHQLAMQALRAGKHVLVEKPFTATAAQADDIVREADSRGLVAMVDHTFVYNPAVIHLKKMIAEGHLGDLLYFDSRRINLGLFNPDADVVWDLAVHDFSILDYLVGEMPSSISAVGAAHIAGHQNNTAFITLQYSNHFVAHVDVNWLSPVKVRQLLLGGSRRMVIYDDLAPESRLRVYDCGVNGLATDDSDYRRRVEYRFGDMWAPHVPSTEPLADLAAHFIDCINERIAPRSCGESGLRIVRILEAATSSLKQGGTPVSIAAQP
jgi:predicted dehydrogenase